MNVYLQYPISIDCQLRCPYCFHADDRARDLDLTWSRGFSLDNFKAWRSRHLDGDRVTVHFHGGEPFTPRNWADIVEYLDVYPDDRVDILTNGLGDLSVLEPYRDRVSRIGLTCHRGVLSDEQSERFRADALDLRAGGYNVYVKELLHGTLPVETYVDQYRFWDSVGLPYYLQDYRGRTHGQGVHDDQDGAYWYSALQFTLINSEYKHVLQGPCRCLAGHRNVIIRGGWMGGDVLACWHDPRVVGNVPAGTFTWYSGIIRGPTGVEVTGVPPVYRGTYHRDLWRPGYKPDERH